MFIPSENPSYDVYCESIENRVLLLEQLQDARAKCCLEGLDKTQIATLEPLWLLSDYLHTMFMRHPAWLDDVLSLSSLSISLTIDALMAGEAFFLQESPVEDAGQLFNLDEPQFLQRLRLYRQWWMVRLIALDLQQKIDLPVLTAHLSKLADV